MKKLGESPNDIVSFFDVAVVTAKIFCSLLSFQYPSNSSEACYDHQYLAFGLAALRII